MHPTRLRATALAAAVCAAAAALVVVPSGVEARAATAGGVRTDRGIDTRDRAAVARAYARLVEAEQTEVDWTGSTRRCAAGSESTASRAATLRAVNFFRGLGHLSPVRLDRTLNAKAQRAALLMDANADLSHTPDRDWRCWSRSGSQAAGRSNLALGISGAGTVRAYMADFGDHNTAVGHRRWIMYPPTRTMGTGSTTRANALWVVGNDTANPAGTPRWTSWPTAGYLPAELEPDGRWSLSSTIPSISFAKAKVRVRDSLGRDLKVRRYRTADGYANNTLVWEVSGLREPTGTGQVSYYVSVTGITKKGSSTTYKRSYVTRFFNADQETSASATARAV